MVCRDKKSECNIDVEEVRTWFNWVICEVCAREFRREKLWRIWDNIDNVLRPDFLRALASFFCKECCPTKMEAWEAYNKKREGTPPRDDLFNSLEPDPPQRGR
tara:strand:+ start:68 stop:376 length:309 start_codon:yes stop_codon:yes gene_type:complete